MKKKIMALMIFIPLMLMLTIFSVGKAVSVVVDIPVSGIRIITQSADGILSLDMASYANDIFIQAEIEPYNAKNKNYFYSVAGVGEDAPADIAVDASTGLLTLNGTGSAKVTVTSLTGGFSDSLIINSYSTKIINLEPTLKDALGESVALTEVNGEEYDYYADISSGIYTFNAGVNPVTLSDSAVIWSSENSDILEINPVTGRCKAKLSGNVDITIDSGNALNENVKKTVRLCVTPISTASGITVNGGEKVELLCAENAEYAEFLVQKPQDSPELSLSGEGMGGVQSYTVTSIDGDDRLRVKVKFNFGHASLLPINISAGGEPNTITLKFEAYTLDVYTVYHMSSDDEILHKKGSSVNYAALCEPYSEDIYYEWSIGDPTKLSLYDLDTGISALSALETGETTLTVTAFDGNGEICASAVKTVKIVAPVRSIEFVDNAVTYGIEDFLTVGGQKLSGGEYLADRPKLRIKLLTDDGLIDYAGKMLTFETSDSDVLLPYVTLTEFKVSAVGEGKAIISASWQYSEYFKENISASITLRAVSEGVNVSSYDELKRVTEDGKKVVLTGDIMLGREDASAVELRAMAKTMPTTYDWQFYKNKGLNRPEVYYLIEFKNDVFGNGYRINGDYFTQAADSTGAPLLFKGPLDFVAIATASVKAQDNIVFLIRTDGITLNNVVLEGCSDESLVEGEEHDLSKLNYTGTTLEIMASATVKNSRISNGRTVVRIYAGGGDDDSPIIDSFDSLSASDERITALIESCILTSAREFILKIGSNRSVKNLGDSESTFAPAPFLKHNGDAYNISDSSNASDEYFREKYVINDVTVKNCVLATSGFFSIGMDTHFTGIMLTGYSNAKITNWTELASTSYASALHLVGDVKLLDWKKLANVDSSTLIETTGEAKPFLTLDIAAMLDKVYNTGSYRNIISDIEGESYVHGGIALYGGGYNYSYVDFEDFTAEELTKYQVNLSILAEGLEEDINNILYMQGTMLPLAAGPEDFRFFMYDSNSENDYNTQQQTLENGTAFTIPRAE